MIYVIMCYSLMLTAAIVWLIRSAKSLSAELDAKARMLELDIAGLEVAVKDASGEIQRLDTIANGLTEDINDMSAGEHYLDECCGKLDERYEAMEARLSKLQTEFEEVVAEEMAARVKSEKAFSDGLESILTYGCTIPTLNKEAVHDGR